MNKTARKSGRDPQDEELLGKMLRYRLKRDREPSPIMQIVILLAGICIIIAILVPNIRAAREKPRSISCLSNVKQIGLGAYMYSEDWDERMPSAANWINETMPYVKNEELYRCPAVIKEHPDGYGYAFNSTLSLQPLAKIKSPEQTPMLFDSPLLNRNANAPDLTVLLRVPRHDGLDSIGYADGHAKSILMDHTP